MPIRILLGRTRWRRRRALSAMGLGGTDPLGRPSFLFVTDTWRKRDQVVADFADRNVFEPDARVWGELISDLWHRHGDGRTILSHRAVALAIHRHLLRPELDLPWPGDPDARGELADAIAHLHRAWGEHGDPQWHEVPHGAVLRRIVTSVRTRLATQGTHCERSEAIAGLTARLAHPSPALQRWLSRQPTVILDDMLQPGPRQTALLIALGRAWSAAGAQVVFSIETGADLGGQEASVFFGFAAEARFERGLTPFAATAALRRAVFDAWIATGEASVWVAGPDGADPIEPWTEPRPTLPADLADHLATGDPLPADPPAHSWLRDTMRLVRCADPEGELAEVAASVRAAIDGGSDPDTCVVAVPDSSRLPALGAALDDVGVPWSLGGGQPVFDHPVAVALRRVAGLSLAHTPAGSALALAHHVGLQLPIPPATLRRWCASAAIAQGPIAQWAAPLDAWLRRTRRTEHQPALAESLAALQRWLDPLTTLATDHPPQAWAQTLETTAVDVGVLAAAGDDATSLRAWTACIEALQLLARDLAQVDSGPWPAALLSDAFERAVALARFRPSTRTDRAVAVVGLLELRGLTPAHTWLVGLSRGAFPRPSPPSFLLPPSLARALQPVDPVAEGRYLLSSLLRNALSEPRMRSVTVTWPATQAGRPVPASPLLVELLDLRLSDGGPPLGERIVCPPQHTGIHGTRSLTRAVATGASEWRSLLTAPQRHELDRQLDLVVARQGALGAYDGQLASPPPAPGGLSVTALETYLRCPARYWYDHALRLDVPEAWAPELEPRRRGTVLHRILERFLLHRGLAPLARDDDPQTAADLHQIAGRELDIIDAEGGFDQDFQDYARHRWLAGLVDTAPRGLLAAWLHHERTVDPPRVPVAVELPFSDLRVGPIKVGGVIDRLDRSPTGALAVTDYKTGMPPTRRLVALGLALQPIAYAEAVAAAYPETPVASVFLHLGRPDALSFRGWTGDPAAVQVFAESARGALVLDASDRRELLDAAGQAAARLVRGRFEPTHLGPSDAGCIRCPHARICRVDHPRMQALQ